jgi:hypothetical protein
MPRKPPKEQPRQVISHSYPPARGDDAERFKMLIRLLLKMAGEKK